jgi:hypothetical protein
MPVGGRGSDTFGMIKPVHDARVVFGVPPEAKDKILPVLDAAVKAMKAADSPLH